MEVLDDVAFESEGKPGELLQTKHHVSRKANLTDASPDIWKSLRVWLSGVSSGTLPGDTLLHLLTTGLAPVGSAASYLRGDSERDPRKARERLDAVAQSSVNKRLQSSFDAYTKLKLGERDNLLSRVLVIDKSPSIIQVLNMLEEILGLVVDRKLVPQLVQRIEGWWFQRVVSHLVETGDPIFGEELDGEITRLRDDFRSDSLPIDASILDETIDPNAFSEHGFVEQLRLIDAQRPRLLKAMREYYRASTHRSRWLREGFLKPGELERYERRLVEEWEYRFDDAKSELDKDESEDNKRRAGRKVYAWVEMDASYPIRPGCMEQFVVRGSYQTLSERLRVGWHPEFRERLGVSVHPEDG
jgi:hypothetical protein